MRNTDFIEDSSGPVDMEEASATGPTGTLAIRAPKSHRSPTAGSLISTIGVIPRMSGRRLVETNR